MFCIVSHKPLAGTFPSQLACNAETFTWHDFIHYSDVIMGTMTSQITSLTIVYSTVYSSADQRKLQSSASLAFVRGIHQWPVNSPHKWPITRKMFPFDDVIVIMWYECMQPVHHYSIQLQYQRINVYSLIPHHLYTRLTVKMGKALLHFSHFSFEYIWLLTRHVKYV